jgi:hypothetical protein
MANRRVQKDKQRSTKHTYKTKDRVTRTPLKTGVNTGALEGFTTPVTCNEECQGAFFRENHVCTNITHWSKPD